MALKHKSEIRNWYNRIAPRFVQRYEGWSGWRLYQFEEAVIRHAADFSEKRVLDLGTGGGRFAVTIKDLARSVTGIDISEAMIHIARASSSDPKVRFLVMDASAMDFPADSFDIVVSLGMFEYIDDIQPILREIRRVLVTGGTFIFVFHQSGSDGTIPREDPEADYYGVKVSERNALWSKAYHDRDSLQRSLQEGGFRTLRIQRVMLALPGRLFWVIQRFFPKPTPLALVFAWFVVAIERISGKLSISSGTAGAAIAFTKKI